MWLQRNKSTIALALALIAGLAGSYWWWESPAQKTYRLLQELRNLPAAQFEIFYFGRSSDQIQADLDRLGSRAVPALIQALDDPDPTIRHLAAGQLGKVHDHRAVEPLIRCVQEDPEHAVRAWAAGVLGDIGDSRGVDPLIACLKSNNSQVRFCSAQALGKIGDKRAFEPLLFLLRDEELYPHAHAIEALGSLGDERAFEVLHRILQSDEDSWYRSMAAKGLGRLGDRRAIAALARAAADPSWQVNEAAKESLARLQQR